MLKRWKFQILCSNQTNETQGRNCALSEVDSQIASSLETLRRILLPSFAVSRKKHQRTLILCETGNIMIFKGSPSKITELTKLNNKFQQRLMPRHGVCLSPASKSMQFRAICEQYESNYDNWVLKEEFRYPLLGSACCFDCQHATKQGRILLRETVIFRTL